MYPSQLQLSIFFPPRDQIPVFVTLSPGNADAQLCGAAVLSAAARRGAHRSDTFSLWSSSSGTDCIFLIITGVTVKASPWQPRVPRGWRRASGNKLSLCVCDVIITINYNIIVNNNNNNVTLLMWNKAFESHTHTNTLLLFFLSSNHQKSAFTRKYFFIIKLHTVAMPTDFYEVSSFNRNVLKSKLSFRKLEKKQQQCSLTL